MLTFKKIFFCFFCLIYLHSSLFSKEPKKKRAAYTGSENSAVDKTHRFISESILDSVLWFDDFFSDKRILEEDLATSSVRIQNDLRVEEDGSMSHRFSFNSSIELKKLAAKTEKLVAKAEKLTQKLRLIIGGESKNAPLDALPKDTIRPGFEKTNVNNYLFSGLRYNFTRTEQSKFFTETGLELSLPFNPYFKNRYERRFHLTRKYYIQTAETVIYKLVDGWKETTELDFSYLITKKIVLQLNNALTFTNPFESVDWGSVVDFKYRISDETAVSYNMGLSGLTNPGSVITSYQARCKLRKRFYRDWLYYEIEQENTWARNIAGRYESKSAITLRLEIHFDN